jgi:hypothetical protein
MGGDEWAVHGKGAASLPRGDNPGDTGNVSDARRVVAILGERLAEAYPCDTGAIYDACREVASLPLGDT